MAKVKVFEAATEGFRLIRREPKAVLVWGLALFVLMGLPMILYLKGFSAAFLQMGELENEQEALRAMGPLFASLPLLILGSIAGYTIVGGAVLRAVIDPEDRRYSYLKLSKAEFWLVLSAVVGLIVAYIGAVLLMLLIMLVFGIVGGLLSVVVSGINSAPGQSMSGAHWGIVLGVLIAEITTYYFVLRFSMAPLMSFDQRRFRLFEAWGFTRGEGWRLFGLAVVLCLAMVALELVLIIPFIGFSGPFWAAMAGDPAAAETLFHQMGVLYASPWMWLIMAISAVLGGAFMALMIAPWARAYVMLKPAEPLPTDDDLAAEAP